MATNTGTATGGDRSERVDDTAASLRSGRFGAFGRRHRPPVPIAPRVPGGVARRLLCEPQSNRVARSAVRIAASGPGRDGLRPSATTEEAADTTAEE